jgi:hypothetical protein
LTTPTDTQVGIGRRTWSPSTPVYADLAGNICIAGRPASGVAALLSTLTHAALALPNVEIYAAGAMFTNDLPGSTVAAVQAADLLDTLTRARKVDGAPTNPLVVLVDLDDPDLHGDNRRQIGQALRRLLELRSSHIHVILRTCHLSGKYIDGAWFATTIVMAPDAKYLEDHGVDDRGVTSGPGDGIPGVGVLLHRDTGPAVFRQLPLKPEPEPDLVPVTTADRETIINVVEALGAGGASLDDLAAANMDIFGASDPHEIAAMVANMIDNGQLLVVDGSADPTRYVIGEPPPAPMELACTAAPIDLADLSIWLQYISDTYGGQIKLTTDHLVLDPPDTDGTRYIVVYNMPILTS